ncbi:hypothetical protein ACFV0O_01915 [Kitasatospora sp. NPDC059577]|uniref:hypothetical protein n=1 Tax=Kitasatospora sp. NPDC059577 TaxID=3346873 RepID=UPI0036A87596
MTATQRSRIVDGTLKFFAFVFGSGAFVFSTLAGSNGSRQVEFILYGIATTALTVLVGSVEARRARTVHGRIEALALETSRGLNELVTAVAPGTTFTANIAGLLAASEDPRAERGRLDQAVAAAAARIHHSCRGVYYSWDPATDTFTCRGRSLDSASPVERIGPGDFGIGALRKVVATGRVFRRTATKSYFRGNVPGTPADDAVVIVRVQAGSVPLGVLAVDAKTDSWGGIFQDPDRQEFSDQHVRQLLMLADLLAGGLAG